MPAARGHQSPRGPPCLARDDEGTLEEALPRPGRSFGRFVDPLIVIRSWGSPPPSKLTTTEKPFSAIQKLPCDGTGGSQWPETSRCNRVGESPLPEQGVIPSRKKAPHGADKLLGCGGDHRSARRGASTSKGLQRGVPRATVTETAAAPAPPPWRRLACQ